MKEIVVLYTGIGIGHVAPMVELAKLLLTHNLSPTIVIPPYAISSSAASLDAFISRVTTLFPAISFHLLPPLSPLDPSPPTFRRVFNLLLLANPDLLTFIQTLTQTTIVRALILDFFCTHALDVAVDLHLPSYVFFSTSASNLAAFIHLPTLHSNTTHSFKDLGDNLIHFPGLHPIPASQMPEELLDRNSDSYKNILFQFDRLPKAHGILTNTFRALEHRALRAISDGVCLPNNQTPPPVYSIGPLITSGSGDSQTHECISWLDSQPKQSVVFLCFGSMGAFSIEQLKETATGLEQSGQRFLWVVKSPPGDDPARPLEVLLPDGFLERTWGRGLVVKSWAPQVEVLGHDSVGGFVTHCGWNSVLEAICAGVAMIGWPLYAEQKMNKLYLVEMGLAVEMRGYDKEVVEAEEVEEKVRWLMETEGGGELRKRAAATKERAMAAMREGGSSHEEVMEFVAKVKGGGDLCV